MLIYDAPRDTLGYLKEICHFGKLYNLFFKAVPWVPKSVNNLKRVPNYFILQNILVLGALSSLRTIGKTSFNVGTFCNANFRRIHQGPLQIPWYQGVQPRGTACCIIFRSSFEQFQRKIFFDTVVNKPWMYSSTGSVFYFLFSCCLQWF